MLLSPIFFASIGLKVSLSKMSSGIILFTICIVGIGIITKIIGCGLGAKLCRFNNKEALQVGIGMVARATPIILKIVYKEKNI